MPAVIVVLFSFRCLDRVLSLVLPSTGFLALNYGIQNIAFEIERRTVSCLKNWFGFVWFVLGFTGNVTVSPNQMTKSECIPCLAVLQLVLLIDSTAVAAESGPFGLFRKTHTHSLPRTETKTHCFAVLFSLFQAESTIVSVSLSFPHTHTHTHSCVPSTVVVVVLLLLCCSQSGKAPHCNC